MRQNAESENTQLCAWLLKALRKCEFLLPLPGVGSLAEEGHPPLPPVLFPATDSASLEGVQIT